MTWRGPSRGWWIKLGWHQRVKTTVSQNAKRRASTFRQFRWSLDQMKLTLESPPRNASFQKRLVHRPRQPSPQSLVALSFLPSSDAGARKSELVSPRYVAHPQFYITVQNCRSNWTHWSIILDYISLWRLHRYASGVCSIWGIIWAQSGASFSEAFIKRGTSIQHMSKPRSYLWAPSWNQKGVEAKSAIIEQKGTKILFLLTWSKIIQQLLPMNLVDPVQLFNLSMLSNPTIESGKNRNLPKCVCASMGLRG